MFLAKNTGSGGKRSIVIIADSVFINAAKSTGSGLDLDVCVAICFVPQKISWISVDR